MKTCPFCAEEIQDDAIVCKHCGKELDRRKVKEKSYRWGPGRILLAIIFIGIMFSVFLASIDDSEPTTPTTTFEERVVTIESEEFDYIDPQVVNVWKSYSDRTLITKLERGEKVILTGRDNANDYCKVRTKEGKEGWIACGWISDF